MILQELRAAARTLREGWQISWEVEGYVISNSIAGLQLEAGKGSGRRLRYFVTLDAAAKVMADDLGITTYTVRGRVQQTTPQLQRRKTD